MPRLTDQQKQDIIGYLEADQPLPDKYRFLLFDDEREVELAWNGKTAEVTNVVLPFQTIERVAEPCTDSVERAGSVSDRSQSLLFDLDTPDQQLQGWTNKLIWGDNKLILSSLENGPLREEIGRAGGLKLIYIDPPFDVGADFSTDLAIPSATGGDQTLTKSPGILENIAYRDTWGKGADSFIAMIHERLILMRDLLAEDGSIYVHCDWRTTALIRLCLEEVFGSDNYINECIWQYKTGGMPEKLGFGRKHDTIHFVSKARPKAIWNMQKEKSYLSHNYGFSNIELFTDDKGTYSLVNLRDVWDIAALRGNQPEKVAYPTQKPEELLQRIVRASTNEGDLVADFFCGSGTTAAVAEKLGRKWIMADLGKFAIHTTRKRMIGVLRELKAEGKNYRAFAILNLGRYERQHYVGINPNLWEADQQKPLAEKEAAFVDLILRAYRAERIENSPTFHGKRSGRIVVVGPANLPVNRNFVEETIVACRQHDITRVDILGFEFEMGLFPNLLDEARAGGIDIAPKKIPAEIFDKRAVEKNHVVFHDVAFIEVKPHIQGGQVAIELTGFSVNYSQDSNASAMQTLKSKASKIVVENGQIVKVTKDQAGMDSREVLTKHWSDWIDYWSVDFDFENRREIIRVPKGRGLAHFAESAEQNVPAPLPHTEWHEVWTGDYVFENEWQSFRTKKNRTLELMSPPHECQPGRHKVAVKVVDLFGNDTMTIVEVSVEINKEGNLEH